MLIYPNIHPIAFHLGPLTVYWYGLMYLFAFLTCWGVLSYRIRFSHFKMVLTAEQLSDLLFYAALGVIIGGRLGYMLFYGFSDLIHDPLLLFQIWKGGMSFHGGLIGVIIALWLFSRKIKKSLVDITDFVAPVVPIGLAFGRLGNFINGELWGRETDVPWGMIFPTGGLIPRHPSQLYEFFLEGIVLFVILWFFSQKPRPRFAISGLFLLGYGLVRFFVEFFRQPDAQMGFIAFDWLTQGQLLSLPMIFLGLGLLGYAYRGIKLCSNT